MSGCLQCPCEELVRLQKEFASLSLFIFGKQNSKENGKCLLNDIAMDRRKISRIESQIGELKDSMRQITVSKVEGTWGIVDKRADIIYSRLIAFPTNGNGKKPYFSTLDVKNILGVPAYGQSKEAMLRCVERHPGQVLIIQRGPKKIGIALKIGGD